MKRELCREDVLTEIAREGTLPLDISQDAARHVEIRSGVDVWQSDAQLERQLVEVRPGTKEVLRALSDCL